MSAYPSVPQDKTSLEFTFVWIGLNILGIFGALILLFIVGLVAFFVFAPGAPSAYRTAFLSLNTFVSLLPGLLFVGLQAKALEGLISKKSYWVLATLLGLILSLIAIPEVVAIIFQSGLFGWVPAFSIWNAPTGALIGASQWILIRHLRWSVLWIAGNAIAFGLDTHRIVKLPQLLDSDNSGLIMPYLLVTALTWFIILRSQPLQRRAVM